MNVPHCICIWTLDPLDLGSCECSLVAESKHGAVSEGAPRRAGTSLEGRNWKQCSRFNLKHRSEKKSSDWKTWQKQLSGGKKSKTEDCIRHPECYFEILGEHYPFFASYDFGN